VLSNSGHTIAEVMQRVRETAADDNDPAFLAKRAAASAAIEAEDEAAKVSNREATWSARGVPVRCWPMLHASAKGEAGGPLLTTALQAVGPFLSAIDKALIMILAGGTGTGKTVAASWGVAFHSGRMVKALDIIKAGLFDQPAGSEEWGRARLLVIDDLGMEPIDPKGYGYAAIYDLMDRRYDANRKTLITTNLTQAEFRERYGTGTGARLWDRVREVGRWVDIGGVSLRKAP
jgi:hypothetical protein